MSQDTIVACPSCGQQHSIPAGQAGQTFACSKCGAAFQAGGLAAAALGYGQPNYGPGGYGQPGPRSGMALASLICGIIFCFPLSAILAVIFGIIGINQTANNRRSGRGMAITGLVLGLFGILVVPLMISILLPSLNRARETQVGRSAVAADEDILLPSLNRARETANRVKCASNMRQIGQAILLYSYDNRGAYPPDMVTLLKTEDITTSVFVCPSSNDTPAARPEDLDAGGHNSYIYVGKGLTQGEDPLTPVLYEKPGSHGNDGSNVLFADGHVEFFAKGSMPTVLSHVHKGP